MGKRKKDEKTASGTDTTSSPPAASSRQGMTCLATSGSTAQTAQAPGSQSSSETETGKTQGCTKFSVDDGNDAPTTSAAITTPPAAGPTIATTADQKTFPGGTDGTGGTINVVDASLGSSHQGSYFQDCKGTGTACGTAPTTTSTVPTGSERTDSPLNPTGGNVVPGGDSPAGEDNLRRSQHEASETISVPRQGCTDAESGAQLQDCASEGHGSAFPNLPRASLRSDSPCVDICP